MAVYVDDFYKTGMGIGNMKMSHMIADSQKELLEMIDKIGMQRKWIQDKDTPREHFDICMSKRVLAIKNGAVAVGMRELASATRSRKSNNSIIILPGNE